MQRELTDAYLRTLRPPEDGRLEIWDSTTPGLVLRVTKGNVATWSVRARRADGKRVRATLGRYPGLGLSKARKAALAALAAIAGGSDPVEEKRQARAERAAKAAEPTVADRLEQWIGARERGWSASYAAANRRLMDDVVGPELGKLPLRSLTREQWTQQITKRTKAGPAAAAALHAFLSAFLGHAEAMGWIDINPMPRKAGAILAPRPAPRERALSDDEIKIVWVAAEHQQPKARAFVRLLILTAARRSEVAGIRIGEVDRGAARWSLPAARAKNDTALIIPLSPLALAELAAVWPNEEEEPDFPLLGRIRGHELSGFSKIVAKLQTDAGFSDWTMHDLRRTARTGMARLGISNEAAEAALNHISGRSALARTYDVHSYGEEATAALKRWQAHVAALVAPRKAASVVPIRGRRTAPALK